MKYTVYGTLLDLIEGQAVRHPDAVAYEDTGDLKLSYREVVEKVRGLSRALTLHGVRRRSRVAIVTPNGVDMALVLLGVAVTATVVPFNPAYRRDEFRTYFEEIGVEFLVVPEDGGAAAREVAAEMGVKVLELCTGGAIAADLSGVDPEAGIERPEPEDVAAILMTSGSTGRPKKVPLTHRNLSVSATDVCRSLSLGPDDSNLVMVEQFNITGINTALTAPLIGGGSSIYTPGFDVAEFFRLLEVKKPTWFNSAPALMYELLFHAANNPVTARPSSLKFIRSGAAAMPKYLPEEIERVFGVPVIDSYAMTEASPLLTSMPLPPAQRKPGSLGRSVGSEIRILGPNGAVLEFGQNGQVAVRGDNVFAGYEDDPEANAQAFRDGWFLSGDIGHLDEDGDLFLNGRVRLMINRGGAQVNPHEVDTVLLGHPDVAQAATFAVAHRTLGEDVAAAVTLEPSASLTERALREYVGERLSEYKVPRRIIFLSRLPRNMTGKVDRKALSEMAAVWAAE